MLTYQNTVEVVEDGRTIQEILLSLYRCRGVSREKLIFAVDRTVHSPEYGKAYQVGIASQSSMSSVTPHIKKLIWYALKHDSKELPLVACLLVLEKFTLRELGCASLLFAHPTIAIPRATTNGTRPHFLIARRRDNARTDGVQIVRDRNHNVSPDMCLAYRI